MVVAALLSLAGAPSASARTQYRGVQLHSLWWDSTNTDMDRELDLAALAGSNVVRVDVGWGNLEESGKGQFVQWYVDKLDRFVNGAQARGMKVIATLWATPCWASSAPEGLRQGCTDNSWWRRGVHAYPPRNAADYGDISRWITARYGSKLAALEVWNEPNLASGFFWNSTNKATDYARLLKAAYPAAKLGNPSVPVLGASLSGSDTTFLRALYANGIKGFQDGLAVHPYADARGFPGLKNLHDLMVASGDDIPAWVTEFGYPTGSDPQWHVSTQEQATSILNAFADLSSLSWVQGASLYNLRDKGTDDTSMEDNFGVVRRDYTLKPGYLALHTALTGLSSAPTPPAPAPPTSGAPARATLAPLAPRPSPASSPVPPVAAPPSSAPTPKPRGRVSAHLVKRRRFGYAAGRTIAWSRVRVSLARCGVSAAFLARADRSGRFERRLGRVARLSRCRISATLL